LAHFWYAIILEKCCESAGKRYGMKARSHLSLAFDLNPELPLIKRDYNAMCLRLDKRIGSEGEEEEHKSDDDTDTPVVDCKVHA